VVCGALLTVAALTGAGYAALHAPVDHTKAWRAPTPRRTGSYGAVSGGAHYGKLAKLLLPVPSGYIPGPDDGQYGNDAQLSASQAASVLEAPYKSLPAAERNLARRSVSAAHVEGLGLRTYQRDDYSAVGELLMVQMRNQTAAKNAAAAFRALAVENPKFRAGPTVHGHHEAYCTVPKHAPASKITTVSCYAAEGDLAVSLTFTGTVPLSASSAATLFQHQLDRVKDPGEAA
jgi:hypothetical protein